MDELTTKIAMAYGLKDPDLLKLMPDSSASPMQRVIAFCGDKPEFFEGAYTRQQVQSMSGAEFRRCVDETNRRMQRAQSVVEQEQTSARITQEFARKEAARADAEARRQAEIVRQKAESDRRFADRQRMNGRW